MYDECHLKGNNKCKENYGSALKSTSGFTVDANDMYGGNLRTEHLTVGNFKLMEVSLEQVLKTPTVSPIGNILEVDLTYPLNIRDLHRDFFLEPTKEYVSDE